MNDLREPLTPPGCNLQDFAFMPLDVRRLLTSETWVLGTGDEKAAAMCLWLESWHQVPAGSLPDNPRMLAHLAQCSRWDKVKQHVLRGWVRCRDGRLYHPVVAEKALEAWVEKLLNSIAGATGNAKRWNVEVDLDGARAQFQKALDLLRALAPRSKTFKKKAVLAIASGSPPDIAARSPPDGAPGSPPDSPPDQPPESARDSPPDSGRDRKGQRQGQGYIPPDPPAGERTPEFAEFIAEFPPARQIRTDDAAKAFAATVAGGGATAQQLVAAIRLQAAVQRDAWARDNGRWAPTPVKWLRERRWRDCGLDEGAEAAWAETRSGIESMGERLGLGRWDETASQLGNGEPFPAYSARVRAAWQATRDESAVAH